MWGSAVRSSKHVFKCAFIFGIILILCSGIAGTASVAHAAVAYGSSQGTGHLITSSCSSAAVPTGQSLLVVLLDRSGSLIEGPTTDPNGYSASVTNALADLWPGSMAVVPFSGSQTPILGPAVLSDPAALADLKNSVNGYPIGGNTPLGPAMHQALKLLQGAAPGSRVIVVTDGNPTGDGNNDGPHQEQDIRQNMLKQFCNQAVPVSAFGLTIDTSTPDGQDANHLLTDIANGTNGSYRPVRTPEELAQAVIQLYAQWLNLSFIKATVQNGNGPFVVDSSAKEVKILTFRSGSSTSVTLDGPDNQAMQGVQSSQDRHYVIDSLSSGSGVLNSGTYTIHTSNDSDVQVYELVKSTLAIDITAPTTVQKLYYNQPVEIEARFVDNGYDKQPRPGEAVMYAKVQFTANGIQRPNQIPLIQSGAIFKGQTETYGQVGTLHIEVDGNDQGLQRSNSIDVQLLKPLPIPPPPPPPCKLGFWGCVAQPFISQHLAQVVSSALGAFLLLLLLFWVTRPSPFGVLESGDTIVHLGQGRSLGRRLFSKSVIPSNQLSSLGFQTGVFDLIFKRGRRAYIRVKSPLTVNCAVQDEEVALRRRQRVELHDGDVIITQSGIATFHKSAHDVYSHELAYGDRYTY